MNCFYNFTVYRTQLMTDKNGIGQVMKTYKKTTSFMCDMQPYGASLVKKIFGEDVICSYVIFADEVLVDDEIVVYNNETLKVKKIIDWIDYKAYALESSDEKCS